MLCPTNKVETATEAQITGDREFFLLLLNFALRSRSLSTTKNTCCDIT